MNLQNRWCHLNQSQIELDHKFHKKAGTILSVKHRSQSLEDVQ